jgi:tRNA threonylcarbamoyl adenosine modification protein YeaZ
MDYLIIDTSGSKNFSTLILGEKQSTISLPAQELTKVIHQSLINLFDKNKILPRDLNFIAICNGPGFFTGIRIGVSVAKALSYSAKVPLIPFHSLELLTAEPHQAKVLDARGNRVYISWDQQPPLLCKIDDISKKIPNTIRELIGADITDLAPLIKDYPLIEKPFSTRSQEKIWQKRSSLGQTEDHISFKIEYLH